MTPTVGFIGLGMIGGPMAERLLACGVPLLVWNRTAEKAAALESRGARRAGTPGEVAEAAEIVVTMVTDGPALEELVMRADGIAAGLSPGKLHCDMSTIDPSTSRRLAAHYAAREMHFLHAPVLGNRRHAAAGQLLIFAGGPQAAIEKCAPVLEALGRKTWHWEKAEQATCVKLACNLLLGGMMELFSESLAFAAKAGVDSRVMLEIIGASALAAPMYQAKGETMLQRDFTPSFALRNMLKDLTLAADAAGELGIALPATHAIRDTFAAAAQHGLAEVDYSAVLEWLQQPSSPRAIRHS